MPNSWDQSWETAVPDGGFPVVLTSDERYIYFIILPADEYERWNAKPGAVYVLRVSDGKILQRLDAFRAHQESRFSAPIVTAAAVSQNTIAILSSQVVQDQWGAVAESSYSVQLVESGSWKTRWTKHFKNRAPRQSSRGYLMASAYPNYAEANINGLIWAQNELLVTGGDRDPILGLALEDGATVWQIDRPWENQRGFTGPSVWSHHIGRWGNSIFDEVEAQSSDAGGKFYEAHDGSIVAGPAVVRRVDGFAGNDNISIFVVVALESKEAWSGYLARSIVYEFSAHGRPRSMADLPRLPLGTKFRALDTSIVWAGQNDSMFRFDASPDEFHGMGPGGPDLITKISWYRQYDSSVKEGVLTSKWAPDLAFYKRHAFRPIGGGVVLKKGEKQIRFPLGVIDLDTGVQTRIDLQVPLTKAIPFPTTNYSSVGDKTTATGPLDVRLAELSVAGDTLRFVLATSDWQGTVDFEMEKVLSLAAASS